MLAVGKRLQKRLDSTEANLNLSLNGAIIEQVKSHKLLSGQHLRLQKRAARVTLNARFNSRSVDLFNTLNWIPFYRESHI